ncbi:MAG TPA: hypothetical protein VFA04_18735 [Bryobacteraceae bacterium]|nr:hypothetical protein [Bryobacteraceae bacterium]
MSDQSTVADEYSPVNRTYLRERQAADACFRDSVSEWLRGEEPFAFGVHNVHRLCAEYLQRALKAFSWRTFQNGARGDLAVRTVKQHATELIEDITRFKCAAMTARIRLCASADPEELEAELEQLPTVLNAVVDDVIASWDPVFWELERFSASLVNWSIPEGADVPLEETFTPLFAMTSNRPEDGASPGDSTGTIHQQLLRKLNRHLQNRQMTKTDFYRGIRTPDGRKITASEFRAWEKQTKKCGRDKSAAIVAAIMAI